MTVPGEAERPDRRPWKSRRSPTAGITHSSRAGGFLSRSVDLTPACGAVLANPDKALILVGIFLRAWVYLGNRSYWMDEGSLLANLKGKPILDFSESLSGDQLAPFLFLILQRCVVAVLGDSGYATRLLPLACGIASLWLFRTLAFRLLPTGAALVALALFAVSDDLVYYSSELKPYSVDLVFGLLLMLTALRFLERPGNSLDYMILGTLAVAAPWVSFASVFIVAGCGAVLFADRLASRRWGQAVALAIVAASWSLSFLVSYHASRALLSPYTTMYRFWDFAFLPFPPRSRADLAKFSGNLAEVFVNPLNLLSPVLPVVGVILLLALLVLGIILLAKRDPLGLLVLILPVILAIAAAVLGKYPFHGRLILELVPAFYLLTAAGAEWLRPRAGRRGFQVLVILLLCYPCLSTLYHASGTRNRDFNAHGDLRRNVFIP